MKLLQATLIVGMLAGAGLSVSALGADLLTTKDGRTVYTFDKDSAGKSTCYESCAATWPAVSPDMMKGGVEAVSRNDGSKQAALGGKPLYMFAGDQKPGDKAGDGMGGVWHVVSGGAAPAKTSAPEPEKKYTY